MATHEDDRAASLAGEDRRSLGADERAELDELRGLLGSTAAWAEPSADLEDRVVTAIVFVCGHACSPTCAYGRPTSFGSCQLLFELRREALVGEIGRASCRERV